jgi:asparagine synthase (glutamine-hydrolysing)
MRTDDGALTIVFNGEIYNYREVRRSLEGRGIRFRTASDTECILHAYRLYGRECLQYLNGMFAIAIWDATNRELFVARDRLGIKPLYLRQDRDGLVFASEIKALLTDPELPRTLDHDAFNYFLRYGYVASPATLLREVRQLPHAHYLVANKHGVTATRYWSVEAREQCHTTEAEQSERVYHLVKSAVERQMVSDVPVGAFLSGGLDSSSVVHLMTEVTGAAVNTYSIGFAGVDAFHNELDDARHVAERYGTNHHEILVTPDVSSLIPRLVHHLDQPLSDSSFIVTYLVSTLARETVKVIISGVGGDELFGGYRRYLGPYLDSYYQLVPRPMQGAIAAASTWLPVDRGSAALNKFRLARAFLDAHGLPPYERYDRAVQLLGPGQVHALSPVLTNGDDSALCDDRRRYFHEVANDPLGQMQRLDLNTSLVDSLLQLTDKMSMATSLETRVPLLDHELVEAAAAIPSSLKIKNGRLRFIQKSSMKGKLPARVLRKKKRGFGCPVGAWFRGELRTQLRDTLASPSLHQRGLLNPQRVEAVIGEHEQYQADHTDLLLALFTFQLWSDDWKVAS